MSRSKERYPPSFFQSWDTRSKRFQAANSPLSICATIRLDLLILDMIMDPGIDGLDTYKKILEINPDQKAIIASGFSETERVKEAQRLGAKRYVRKPYTIEKIGAAVKKELEK